MPKKLRSNKFFNTKFIALKYLRIVHVSINNKKKKKPTQEISFFAIR